MTDYSPYHKARSDISAYTHEDHSLTSFHKYLRMSARLPYTISDILITTTQAKQLINTSTNFAWRIPIYFL